MSSEQKDPAFEKWWAKQSAENPDLAPGSYWGEILKEFIWSGWRACLEHLDIGENHD